MRRPPVDVQRLIIAASRAPLSQVAEDVLRPGPGRLVRGAGGLVTALAPLAASTGAVWVAVARDDGDRDMAARAGPDGVACLRDEHGAGYRVAFATPEAEAYDLFYNVISNPLLWFIHHYLWDLAREPVLDASTDRAWRDGYQQVNQLVADRVLAAAASMGGEPTVLVQDYQLYLVPEMVRAELPHARIQHFVHVPWPSAAYWTILPGRIRDGILHGILGSDIVGFQTRHDVRNFLLTCEENLGLSVDFGEGTVFYQGRAVRVRSYPISIDVDAFERLASSPATLEQQALIDRWRPPHLILRVDRTDLSKNIVRGFLAYERMLETHHELHGDVQFWAFMQPSRQDIDDYRAYLGNVLAVAARINRRFQSGGWAPIRVEIDNHMNRAVAAYRSFDVLLVNPIYDGMNLVAKEGMICNRRNGVLVLSENAGTHAELGELALSINPFDVDETAEAMYLGLIMSEQEREARAERIREVIRDNDLARWITSQLADLADLDPSTGGGLVRAERAVEEELHGTRVRGAAQPRWRAPALRVSGRDRRTRR